jgi:hypothetical protein
MVNLPEGMTWGKFQSLPDELDVFKIQSYGVALIRVTWPTPHARASVMNRERTKRLPMRFKFTMI